LHCGAARGMKVLYIDTLDKLNVSVSGLTSDQKQGFPMPPTDPRDAVAQRKLNIPYRIINQTISSTP